MTIVFDFFKKAYEKKPFLLVLLISASLTLPWITLGDFYTKGEPREATVATCMLNTGNWILPSDYADEVAYKPPFMHWFVAAFSLPSGHVSETTARLPSALGLIAISLLLFGFLYKRVSRNQALLATLLLLTSFEMHRSGLEARVDMTLALFMIGGLLSLFRWEEKGLKGFPWLIPVFLGGAALVKGPVGIVLPCLVFGVYLLLLQRYSLWKIILKNILVALPALAFLLVWYYLAFRQGGQQFLNIVYAENFGRFLGTDNKALGISYELGHEGPFWYYLPTIIVGFLPWSLLLLASVFVIPFKKLKLKQNGATVSDCFRGIAEMNKVTLFSIVAVVIILLFYSIPISKRSVYIMPAYPFAAYLLVLFFDWLIDTHSRFIGGLTRFIVGLCALVLLLVGVFTVINLSQTIGHLIHHPKTLNDVMLFSEAFYHPSVLMALLWLLLLAAVILVIVGLRKLKTGALLFATIGLFICLQLFLEGAAYPVFKNGYSSRPFAEYLQKRYPLKGNTYVTCSLKEYPNLYGLNFYLGNNFKNFEKTQAQEGYFLTGKESVDKIMQKYGSRFEFKELERTPTKFNDFNDVIILYRFKKI